jgi:hypothetical protein
MRPGTGFFGFNTVKYEPTPAPAISATTTTAIDYKGKIIKNPDREYNYMVNELKMDKDVAWA